MVGKHSLRLDTTSTMRGWKMATTLFYIVSAAHASEEPSACIRASVDSTLILFIRTPISFSSAGVETRACTE
jgi:hypothetical protein